MLVEQLREATDKGIAEKIASITAAMQQAAATGDKMLVVEATDDMDINSVIEYYKKEGLQAKVLCRNKQIFMSFNWQNTPSMKKHVFKKVSEVLECCIAWLRQKGAQLNQYFAGQEHQHL